MEKQCHQRNRGGALIPMWEVGFRQAMNLGHFAGHRSHFILHRILGVCVRYQEMRFARPCGVSVAGDGQGQEGLGMLLLFIAHHGYCC